MADCFRNQLCMQSLVLVHHYVVLRSLDLITLEVIKGVMSEQRQHNLAPPVHAMQHSELDRWKPQPHHAISVTLVI